MNLFKKLKRMEILLVDDDEWIRDSLALYFESEGCHLTTLETAEEGVEALKKHDYDILLTDYRLPGMDGLEFLRHIRSTQPHIMTILITAYKSDDIVSEAMKLGIRGFIEKPFTNKTIEESLTRVVKKMEERPHENQRHKEDGKTYECQHLQDEKRGNYPRNPTGGK